jgi:hypothetical protein
LRQHNTAHVGKETTMSQIHRTLALLFVAAALGACEGTQIGTAASDRGSVQGRLAEIGVDMADVEGIEFTVVRGSEEAGVIDRWAWAKMKSCDGYIVVRTSGGLGRSGSQPYATGNCRLPEPRGR